MSTIERRKRPTRPPLQEMPRARNPVVTLAVNQMRDDLVHRPAVRSLVHLRPVSGKANEERLIRDAGFDPVMVGTLAQSRQFDLGQPLAQGNLSAADLRARMN